MRTVKSTSTGQSQVFSIPCAALNAAADGTVTFTAATPHRLSSEPRVRVLFAGAPSSPQSLYAGDFLATVLSPTVFTYRVRMPESGVVATPPPVSIIARQLLPATEYEPFALVRNNRLQVEERTPDKSQYIADTAAHAGNWVALLALEDCVFNALDSTTLSGFASGMPLPKGATLRGVFSNVKLTSGKLLAHE